MSEQALALAEHQRAIARLTPILEAMRSIAEIAWRRAAERLEPLAAYRDEVAGALNAAAATLGASERSSLLGPPPAGPAAVLLVTAERGLCGPFAARLVRVGLQHAQEVKKEGRDVRLLCLGSRGRALLEASGQSLLYARPLPSLAAPTYVQIEALALELLDLSERGAFARLEVIYHAPTKRFQYTPVIQPLLPPAVAPAPRRASAKLVRPAGDAPALVALLLSEAALTGLYQAVIASAVSEQLARVYAMRLAVERSQRLLDELTLAHNAAVQQEVTNDLLEVVAGFEAAAGG